MHHRCMKVLSSRLFVGSIVSGVAGVDTRERIRQQPKHRPYLIQVVCASLLIPYSGGNLPPGDFLADPHYTHE
jgi:hypothetical protein